MTPELILASIYLLTRIMKLITLYKLSRTEGAAKSMIKAVNINAHVNQMTPQIPVKKSIERQVSEDNTGKYLNVLIKEVETSQPKYAKYISLGHKLLDMII